MFAEFVMPVGVEWGYVTAVGIFATMSQLLMTKAYELTKAGIVGTISYTNIVFAVVIGVMLGDPIPNVWTVLGIILVIMSGLIKRLPSQKETDDFNSRPLCFRKQRQCDAYCRVFG